MEIIGFILVMFIGIVLFVYGFAIAYIGTAFGESVPIFALIPVGLACLMFWYAYENSPFTLIVR